ncbi:hypothetical protein ACIP6X_24255 [Streptomyces coeruleorubidus]|uniref:hypothetical protein n=1 Tax=Streptomyces coeruleorubidus TaxID=116188 RepID=UPI00380A5E7B
MTDSPSLLPQRVVELPLHTAWSGLTSYDRSKPRQGMGLYRTVLHEGLRDASCGKAAPEPAGAAVRVVRRFLALTAAIWHNHHTTNQSSGH